MPEKGAGLGEAQSGDDLGRRSGERRLEESAAGWQLLWDGHSTAGWRSAYGKDFLAEGWMLTGGMLTIIPTGNHGQSKRDIITVAKYANFELSVDFKIAPGTNSGCCRNTAARSLLGTSS